MAIIYIGIVANDKKFNVCGMYKAAGKERVLQEASLDQSSQALVDYANKVSSEVSKEAGEPCSVKYGFTVDNIASRLGGELWAHQLDVAIMDSESLPRWFKKGNTLSPHKLAQVLADGDYQEMPILDAVRVSILTMFNKLTVAEVLISNSVKMLEDCCGKAGFSGHPQGWSDDDLSEALTWNWPDNLKTPVHKAIATIHEAKVQKDGMRQQLEKMVQLEMFGSKVEPLQVLLPFNTLSALALVANLDPALYDNKAEYVKGVELCLDMEKSGNTEEVIRKNAIKHLYLDFANKYRALNPKDPAVQEKAKEAYTGKPQALVDFAKKANKYLYNRAAKISSHTKAGEALNKALRPAVLELAGYVYELVNTVGKK